MKVLLRVIVVVILSLVVVTTEAAVSPEEGVSSSSPQPPTPPPRLVWKDLPSQPPPRPPVPQNLVWQRHQDITRRRNEGFPQAPSLERDWQRISENQYRRRHPSSTPGATTPSRPATTSRLIASAGGAQATSSTSCITTTPVVVDTSTTAVSALPVQTLQSPTENTNETSFAKDPALAQLWAARPNFRAAAWIAFGNLLLFAFRPDPDIPWPTRVPRILWEGFLWLHVRQSPQSWSPQPGTAMATNAASLSWRAFLLGTTGLADLFVWAPLYGVFVNFRTCEGGWLQPKVCRMDPIKGYSRLWVVVQSILGGMVYLRTAFQILHYMYLQRDYNQRQQQQQQSMARHPTVVKVTDTSQQ